ncbi:MAG: hypothetical protein U0573_09340 [Phycisphaerales bacterium]|nr:hypothetical protein [Planctomycetota bacterium]
MIQTRKMIAHRLALASLAGASILLVAGCNTVSGFGQDLNETSDNTKKAFSGSSSGGSSSSNSSTSSSSTAEPAKK